MADQSEAERERLARAYAEHPGRSWRLACEPASSFYHPFEVKSTDGEHIGDFDELVVDHWLHLEKMDTRAWWLQLGPLTFWVTIATDGEVSVMETTEEGAE